MKEVTLSLRVAVIIAVLALAVAAGVSWAVTKTTADRQPRNLALVNQPRMIALTEIRAGTRPFRSVVRVDVGLGVRNDNARREVRA